MRARVAASAAAVAFLSVIVVANYVVARFGVVPVGFGLMAPAAVYVVGFAFLLRDAVHELAGRAAVIVIVLAGAAVSYAVASPRLAAASATAFAVSELADTAAYMPLRRRGRWLAAVVVSNVIGLALDSVLFLWIAFGSLEYLPGQAVGKAWATAAAVCVAGLIAARRRESAS